jgi:pimeloyl-ACP methyl ester carboxylesterase
MWIGIMKRLTWLIAIGLCLHLAFSSSALSAPEEAPQVKELNFVFLHGAGGNICSLQLLADTIIEQLPAYVLEYEQANPDIEIRVDALERCYPNDVDIHTWAKNIAKSVKKYFPDKSNLILVGHSMGGKAALYGVAQNIDGLANKVMMVVTINSPIKPLDRYYVTGGGSALDFCRARWLLADQGICRSAVYYDSSQDGHWVSFQKHWLAFISGEAAPFSEQFNFGGVDAAPRDMDDSAIPISAQYSEDADAIYYGEYGHSDFAALDDVAGFIAEQILRYIFGGYMECSVLARGGTFEHQADWLLGTDSWENLVGEVLASSGSLQHINESYLEWQEWEDVVGECLPEGKRSSYQISQESFLPLFTGVKESHWLNPDDHEDCRLYLKTRVAPRNRIQVYWRVHQRGLLPAWIERDRYEVEIVTGTPLTNISSVSWVTDNPRDLRLLIESEAESPFRWFKAEWRVYSKESRWREVINEIPAQTLPGATPGD